MSNWQNTAPFLRESVHILVFSGGWDYIMRKVNAPKRQDHNLGPTIVNLITLGFNLV